MISLVNFEKLQSSQRNMPLKQYFKRYKQQKMTFRKLLGWQLFYNSQLQPVQSSVSLAICASFCIFCVIYFFNVFSGYVYVSLNLVAVPNVWIWLNSFEAWLWGLAFKRPVLGIFMGFTLTKSFKN